MDRQGARRDAPGISLTAPSIERSIAVQHLAPTAAGGHTHTIILPRHRCKVADKQSLVRGISSLSEEANDPALRIAAVHPFKPGRIEIDFEQGRLASIERVQIADPSQQSGVE